MNKKFLTIGELSLRTSLSEKTIRFYSDKNLIVPDYVNPKTNYRYYKPYQILKIKLISSLKEKGFSLKEIQQHIENSKSQKMDDFFKNHKDKLEEIDKKIEELEIKKKNILCSIESLNPDTQEKITIKRISRRNFMHLDDAILSENVMNTFQILDSTIGNGYAQLGNLITRDNGDYQESSILIFQDNNESTPFSIEESIFLTINYSTDRDLALKKIFDFSRQNKLKIEDTFYELELVNFFMTENKNDHIKEIQVPIKIKKPEKKILKDGIYSSSGFGYNGEIHLNIIISNNNIRKINITSHNETSIISVPAFEIIPKLIIQKNCIYVPNVSGCSYTSKGIKDAVLKALIQAGADEEYLNFLFFKSNTLPKIGWDKDSSKKSEENFDVVIIGAGAAGLSAAIEVRKQGLSVGVFEKMPYIGGNTLLSLGTFIFPDYNDPESVKNLKNDMLSVGKNLNSLQLVDSFLKNLRYLEEWLSRELNIKLKNDGFFKFKLNRYLKKRIPGKYGIDLISHLKERTLKLGGQIFTNSICKNLIYEEDHVKGVIIEIKGIEKQIKAKKVILASGGFSQNVSFRKSVAPRLDFRYNSTNNSGNSGDGIIFSQKLDAKLLNIDAIETIPFACYGSGDLSYMGFSIYDGAILINKDGKRFSKENMNRNILSEAILSQKESCAFILWDSSLEKINNYTSKFSDEASRNILNKNFGIFNSIKDGCDSMGIDFENLESTLNNYNGFVRNREDLEFNRRNLASEILVPPFYFFKVSPSVHYTNGGLAIDEKTQVLNNQNIPIKNLFAAGEITGGLHGEGCLTGLAISDSIIFGIISGSSKITC